MKRDWDLVRELLNLIEGASYPGATITLSDFPEARHAEVSYHAELLLQAGLVDGQMSKTLSRSPHNFSLRRLTWNGHEFLDAIRSQSLWDRTKGVFKTKGIEMTVDLVKSVATDIAKAALDASIGK